MMKRDGYSISVIIPIYNSGKYLTQCINTILMQSFSDFELILVDDCSDDGSERIIDEFAIQDDRIKVLHRREKSGSAAAPRNDGLRISSGEYVIFLDSDDYFHVNLLEKLFFCAKETEADMVMCDNYNVYGDDEISTDKTELHYDLIPNVRSFSFKDIPDRIFQISSAAVWHRLYRREFLLLNGIFFQIGVPILDDIYFSNISTIYAKNISIVKERLVYYRREREGAQTSRADISAESVYYSLIAVYKELRSQPFYDEIKSSLQIWFISTLKWWLGCISSEDIYRELLYLYKIKYLPDLGLLPDNLSAGVNDYCRRIVDYIVSETMPMLINHFIRVTNEKKSIILYGAGVEGRKIYEILKQKQGFSIVCWCDKNPTSYDGRSICTPDILTEIKEYDYVFIAINNRDTVYEVKKNMLSYGILENKMMAIIS